MTTGSHGVSLRARAEITLARLQRKKAFYADAGAMRAGLAPHQDPARTQPPRSVRRSCDVFTTDIDGHRCHTITPRGGADGDLHVFHLHGGGFVEHPESHHWEFAKRLVGRLGCSYTLPMYPLAPAHAHRTIIGMAIEAFHRTMADTPPSSQIMIGDSAGGSLALSIAQHLRDHGDPQPACIALFSPWLDLATDHPDSLAIEPDDPELGVEGLQQAARWYAAGRDPHDPYISPAHADLRGLAPLIAFVGTRDILLPDSLMLHSHEHLRQDEVELHVYDGMFHNWMMKNLPEADSATEELVGFIGAHTRKRNRR